MSIGDSQTHGMVVKWSVQLKTSEKETAVSYDEASVTDRINKIFSEFDDPSSALEKVIDLLDEICSADGEYGPITEIGKADKASKLYEIMASKFINRGYQFAAETLFLDGWNKFGRKQLDTKQRIYRAALAFRISRFYGRKFDRGAAIRWALYTQADDMLGEHKQGGGQGKHDLVAFWGMSDDALSEFNKIASQNVTTVKRDCDGDWSRVPGFAEDVVRRFALERPTFAHLFAEESSLQEFVLSQAYFSALLAHLNATHKSTKEKGDALEELASYLLSLVPGWVPRRNLYGMFQSSEIDLVVRNLSRPSNLTAELLGRHFLVECKNWEKPVGVEAVGYFLYRMHLAHAKFGVLLAKSGITGDEVEETASRSLIRKAFHEDGNICIVLTEQDFARLASERSSFWPMLLDRIEGVQFGEPRDS